ncbi:hypothetical protein Patl1_33838 [Pistacia atlantica]|uniref:Uncharacterized protein n=1 Tax=Pistacia atlantica TaxID=434234 RepID=A0ACC0ZU55_9ROSI|nr:hypothetical protein Patl1_33838 [Pistacia atlantica]
MLEIFILGFSVIYVKTIKSKSMNEIGELQAEDDDDKAKTSEDQGVHVGVEEDINSAKITSSCWWGRGHKFSQQSWLFHLQARSKKGDEIDEMLHANGGGHRS